MSEKYLTEKEIAERREKEVGLTPEEQLKASIRYYRNEVENKESIISNLFWLLALSGCLTIVILLFK